MAASAKARVVVSASDNIVRVHVPAETLYNLDQTQQLMRSVLGRLGCPNCHSGRFIIFQQEEGEFRV
jgi:hypothetical protein